MNFGLDDGPVYGGDDMSLIDPDEGDAVFSTYNEDYGISPEPRPSKELTPTWYDEDALDSSIINALNLGWINRTPAKMDIDATGDSGRPQWQSEYHRSVVNMHDPDQTGDMSAFTVTKLMSYWTVCLPDGYSMLMTEPLSRNCSKFTPFSGVIDYDKFPTITHCPGRLNGSFKTTFEPGLPLFQMIPFKRDEMIRTATTRTATEEEAEVFESRSTDSEDDADQLETSVEVKDLH